LWSASISIAIGPDEQPAGPGDGQRQLSGPSRFSRSYFVPPPSSDAAEPEAVIVERARAGDRDAFATLVRLYQQPLGGYLSRLTGNRELALDLTQETFVRAYVALGATQSGLAIRAWFFRIATNLAYDALRRLHRVAWTSLAALRSYAGDDETTSIEERELVRLALASLRPEEQAVLLLCSIEQQTYAQVALILESSPDAVRKRLGRAKKRFRSAYLELSEG
jgi:RNA polymerase sigma-70 factor (ECF subfamily)